MNENILTQIRLHYSHFTKAERLVADYVLSHPHKVVYHSINDMANACEVSETSVFRFCRVLDQKGYQDFKLNVAQAIASSTADPALAPLTGAVTCADDLRTVSQKVLSSYIRALQETFQALKYKEVQVAVQWLVDAENIHFFGLGKSMIAAMEAQSRFMALTPKAHMHPDYHLQLMDAALMNKHCVGILFSYSGATKESIAIAQRVKDCGAKLIGVSRYAKSSLGKYCDITLLCGASEGPLQGGSMSSRMSQLYLLDMLYLEFYKQTYEHSARQQRLSTLAVLNPYQ